MGIENRERFELLFEGMSSNLQLLAEGHGVVIARLDGLDRKLEAVAADVSVLKLDVSVLKQDVSVLKQDVSVLKKDMRGVKDHLGLDGSPRSVAKRRKKS